MSTTPDIETNPYRLSKVVIPSAYRLRLEPDLARATFAGSVEIDVDVTERVATFTLNAVELEVSAASLEAGGRSWTSGAPVLDEQFETATFTFDEELPLGPATLRLTFTGLLNDQLHGLPSTPNRRAEPGHSGPALSASIYRSRSPGYATDARIGRLRLTSGTAKTPRH